MRDLSLETALLSSGLKMKAGRNSKSEIASGLYNLLCRWLTSSHASTAKFSARDLAFSTSEARETIRGDGDLAAKSNRSKKLGPSSARNSSVRVLYAALIFSNPRLRSCSSARVLRISSTSRNCCYQLLVLRVSCLPSFAAVLCRADQEPGVH